MARSVNISPRSRLAKNPRLRSKRKVLRGSTLDLHRRRYGKRARMPQIMKAENTLAAFNRAEAKYRKNPGKRRRAYLHVEKPVKRPVYRFFLKGEHAREWVEVAGLKNTARSDLAARKIASKIMRQVGKGITIKVMVQR